MDWSALQLEDIKENTALWKMKKLSKDVFKFLLKVVREFKTLFLSKESSNTEQVRGHTLKDLG